MGIPKKVQDQIEEYKKASLEAQKVCNAQQEKEDASQLFADALKDFIQKCEKSILDTLYSV